MTTLLHGEITDVILRCYFEVYNELGPGFLESVYKKALCIAINDAGMKTIAEKELSVSFRGHDVGVFRADLIVDDKVVVELKAARAMERQFEAQLINYLKASQMEVGLVLNFGPKAEFRRIVV